MNEMYQAKKEDATKGVEHEGLDLMGESTKRYLATKDKTDGESRRTHKRRRRHPC